MSVNPFFQNFQWHPISIRIKCGLLRAAFKAPSPLTLVCLQNLLFCTSPLPAQSPLLPPLPPPLSSASSSLQLLSSSRQRQRALSSSRPPPASATLQVPRTGSLFLLCPVSEQGSAFFFPFSRPGLLKSTLAPPLCPGSPSKVAEVGNRVGAGERGRSLGVHRPTSHLDAVTSRSSLKAFPLSPSSFLLSPVRLRMLVFDSESGGHPTSILGCQAFRDREPPSEVTHKCKFKERPAGFPTYS